MKKTILAKNSGIQLYPYYKQFIQVYQNHLQIVLGKESYYLKIK